MHADLECRNMPLPNLKEKSQLGRRRKKMKTRARRPRQLIRESSRSPCRTSCLILITECSRPDVKIDRSPNRALPQDQVPGASRKKKTQKTKRRGAPSMFIVSPHPRYDSSTHFIHRPAPNGPVHPPSTHSLGEPRAIEHNAPGPPQHGVLVSMGPEHRRSAPSPSDVRMVMSLTLFSSFEEEFARKCVLPREEAGP